MAKYASYEYKIIPNKEKRNEEESLFNSSQVYREDLSQQDRMEYYNEWAIGATYEEDLCPSRYKGPRYTACAAAKYLKENKSVKIIDVAAGTGFVGEQLQIHGFTNIDALDPSDAMLDIAKKKSIYKTLICNFFGGEGIHIPDDSYGALVSCGGMGEGHLPCESLKEMIRIVKPGGIVVIVMREEYLTSVKDYYGHLEPLMSDLEEGGFWRTLERKTLPNYFMMKNGSLYVFEVLSQGFDTAASTK